MRTVLHIAPHLGGGVGRVLLNYFKEAIGKEQNEHMLICLDTVNNETEQKFKETGVSINTNMCVQTDEIRKAISTADIVLIHWWNHPLLYDLMVRQKLPPARMLIWSHVSGYTPTQCFTDKLLLYPDMFIVAAPYSLDTPAIGRLSPQVKTERIRMVFSCAGIQHVASSNPIPHKGFTVGYVGAVDDWKMHRNFISMSASANIPDVQFVVCGGPMEAQFQKTADQKGVGYMFQFCGHVQNVSEALNRFDVFGYPINPGQAGTGEQALIEALAAGVPPVVLNNGAERFIVKDGVTGIIANSEKEYTRGLEFLYQNPDKRHAMSDNARRDAQKRFTIDKTLQAWQDIYDEAMQLPKCKRKWGVPSSRTLTSAQLFILSLGENGKDFKESLHGYSEKQITISEKGITRVKDIHRSETRGSVFHYRSFFPEDPYLNLWCGLIRLSEGKMEEGRRYVSLAAGKMDSRRFQISDHFIRNLCQDRKQNERCKATLS